MASVGEALLEEMKSETPEAVPDEPVVEQTTAPTEEKPRRQRKKPEAAEAPPAEPVAETPTEPAPDAPAAPQQPEFLRRLESDLGFQNVTDENEGRDRLLEYTLRERQQWEQQRQDYERKLRDAEYRQTAQAAQQTTEKPAAERKPWEPPVAYPDTALRYIEKNAETGASGWKENTPAPVRASAEQWIAYCNDFNTMLQERPDLFWTQVKELVRAESKEVVEPYYEQQTAAQQRETFFRQFEQQNAEWLYTQDPVTGQAGNQFTRVGALLNERVGYHLERGLTPQEAVDYAQYDVQRQTGQTPWLPAEPTPQQVRQQKKNELESRARGGANSIAPRRGSFTEPEDSRPQNGNLSPGRSLIQLARQQGVEPLTAVN